jgi:hypothetical protein
MSTPPNPLPSETTKPEKAPTAQFDISCNKKRDWIDKGKLGLELFGLAVVITYTIFTIKIWRANREAADAAAKAAGAAEGANKIATQQLELSTRPWVMAEMASAGPITFDSAGGRVNFAIRATNVGHSPAINVNIKYKVLNSQSPNILGAQLEICPSSGAIPLPKGVFWGATLFPGKDFIQPIMVTLEKPELDKKFISFPEGTLLLHVVGCIDYVLGSSDNHHQTFFNYDLEGIADSGKTESLMNGTDIPSKKIRIFSDSHIGGGAN